MSFNGEKTSAGAMRLAAQGYTLREFTKSGEQVVSSLEKVRAIGYDAIQISGFAHYDPSLIARTAERLGLGVCVTHVPLQRLKEETGAVIAEHKLFGAKYIGLGYAKFGSLDDVKQFLKDIGPAVKKIADAGMKFLYHNHHHEFIKFDGVTPMRYMLENTDEREFGILADFYWLQYAGVSPERFLRDNKSRINLVHLKDMKVNPDGVQFFSEIFEGNMDYNGLLKACKETGIEWAVVEQDVCEKDPFESLKISYNNIRSRGF